MKVAGVLALAVSVSAQYGFYDLQGQEDTKLVGTTEAVVPSCFSTPNGFCANGGQTVFTPDGTQNSLVAWYNFDDAIGLDSSGMANHATSPVPDVGPGHQGRGNSAHFNGGDKFTIGHTSTYDGMQQMTVSFWMYLLTDSTDSWRVVFRKGDGEHDLTPTLLMFPDSRKLHARVSTTDPSKNGLDSIASIPLRRWTHVAIVLNYNVLTIFVNGIKDNEGLLTGQVVLNQGSWYLGKDLYLPGTGMYMDNFKVYDFSMDEAAIQIEAGVALPGYGPNFLRLGCKSCDLATAIEKCAATGGYHLCRKMELTGGGLIVARAMGYTEMSSDQWYMEDASPDIDTQKLGLCCLD